MRLLHISSFINEDNGANVVIKRNIASLRNVENLELYTYTIKCSGFEVLYSMLCGSSYGVSFNEETKIFEFITSHHIDTVFIEGTLMGRLVKQLRKRNITSVIFAHNIDVCLYKQRFCLEKSVKNCIKYFLVSNNEKKVINNANYVITLNERDAKELKRIYNRNSDMVIPISCSVKNGGNVSIGKRYCLFVGSDFFPNNYGAVWFIKNVAPYIDMDFWIVGTCSNVLYKLKDLPDNVQIKGFVDDLDSCYLNAECVVAPIFSGSGMKTKIIEALSYSKSIIGTAEAFQGIDGDISMIGHLCSDAKDFITAINSYKGNKTNDYSSWIFRNKYSDDIIQLSFNYFIKNISRENS